MRSKTGTRTSGGMRRRNAIGSRFALPKWRAKRSTWITAHAPAISSRVSDSATMRRVVSASVLRRIWATAVFQ